MKRLKGYRSGRTFLQKTDVINEHGALPPVEKMTLETYL